MCSRGLLAGAATGWLVLAAAAGTAMGQARAGIAVNRPALVEDSFLADFATVYECLERVARDRGMIVSQTGSGGSWQGRLGTDESFVVVADGRTFPSLEERILAHFVHHVPGKKLDFAAMRKVYLDLDTGRLTGPEGVDLSGLRMLGIGLNLTLKRPEENVSCQVALSRDFSDEKVKVSVSREGKDGRAFSRELMTSLESRLKLARKLGEVRKKARRGEPREPRASDPKPGEPTSTGPGRPKAVGSPG